jgi:Arc/MetJ-type ribon-helix-helix transcriptional regulator
MKIDIAPETERIVREELSSGHFKSVDELILSSVQAWRERNLTPPHRARAAGIDKAREFVAWAKRHPATLPLSDEAISRASLNPDAY